MVLGFLFGVFEVSTNLVLLALDVHVSPLYFKFNIIFNNIGRLVEQPSLLLFSFFF